LTKDELVEYLSTLADDIPIKIRTPEGFHDSIEFWQTNDFAYLETIDEPSQLIANSNIAVIGRDGDPSPTYYVNATTQWLHDGRILQITYSGTIMQIPVDMIAYLIASPLSSAETTSFDIPKTRTRKE